MGELGRRIARAPAALLLAAESAAALLAATRRVKRRGAAPDLALRSAHGADEAPSGPADAAGSRPGSPPSGAAEACRRIARGVDRACRLLPWAPSCLVRALALERLLRRRRLGGTRVRVGVRRREGEFSAHAWLECGGEVVGDAPERVAEFEPLSGLEVSQELR